MTFKPDAYKFNTQNQLGILERIKQMNLAIPLAIALAGTMAYFGEVNPVKAQNVTYTRQLTPARLVLGREDFFTRYGIMTSPITKIIDSRSGKKYCYLPTTIYLSNKDSFGTYTVTDTQVASYGDDDCSPNNKTITYDLEYSAAGITTSYPTGEKFYYVPVDNGKPTDDDEGSIQFRLDTSSGTKIDTD